MASRGSTVSFPPGWVVKLVLACLAVFLMYHLGSCAVRSALDLPEVHRSYLTKECIKVENADGTAGDCKHLPERYNNVWVY